jgi:hypothetical protein
MSDKQNCIRQAKLYKFIIENYFSMHEMSSASGGEAFWPPTKGFATLGTYNLSADAYICTIDSLQIFLLIA